MEPFQWVRGEEIGHGSFASVSKAQVTAARFADLPTSIMAVKTCEAALSDSLREEKRILDAVGVSPQIVRCFGDCSTVEMGQSLYNILLEFAPGGSLADEIQRRRGSGLAESEIRRYARAVLEGLSVIHAKGFVHCDIKPHNILIFGGGEAKIADFGLAKEKEAKVARCQVRGTPLYMAPESVNANQYEASCDIWALGCMVSEMASGKPAWPEEAKFANMFALLMRIGDSDDIPNIPEGMSEDGRDFLRKCFVKDPEARWTAQMLLSHPFISHCERDNNHEAGTALTIPATKAVRASPRSHFCFEDSTSANSESPVNRIKQLVSASSDRDGGSSWDFSSSWLTVL